MILGASARAAAFSARRCGLSSLCADLFADRDLTDLTLASSIPASAYPSDLAHFASKVDPTPWLYTGALENYPDLVDAISIRHRLLGNPGSTLQRVRDPIAVASVLREQGLHVPEVCLNPSKIPLDGSWLRKPLASAGGHGIRPWYGGKSSRTCFYQRKIQGLSLAAIYTGQQGVSTFQGVTRQFIARQAGQPGLSYRGSLGPWPVPSQVLVDLHKLGSTLASAFNLIGIFGVDLILDGSKLWTIEVNPRYTASVEVLEWAQGHSILSQHFQACGHWVGAHPHPRAPAPFVAKAILRARQASHWNSEPKPTQIDLLQLPEIADIPQPGTRFSLGDPVVTVFGLGQTAETCRRHLAGQLNKVKSYLIPDMPNNQTAS